MSAISIILTQEARCCVTIRAEVVNRDNDNKFGKWFVASVEGTGVDVVKIPPRSPNLNPICERSLGSVRRE
jgi:hypothetical protein